MRRRISLLRSGFASPSVETTNRGAVYVPRSHRMGRGTADFQVLIRFLVSAGTERAVLPQRGDVTGLLDF